MTTATLTTPLDLVLSRLRKEGMRQTGPGVHQALCPAHDDRNASLVVTEKSPGGQILLHCHAGCEFPDILHALGLEAKDLFPQGEPAPKPRIVATYDYVDEKNVVLYQSVRFEPKAFRQRRPIIPNHYAWTLAGGWFEPDNHGGYRLIKGAEDKNVKPNPAAAWRDAVRTVLYRLPEVLETVEAKRTVVIAEGEKDADNLHDKLKLTATTNPMGAGKWRKHYSDSLKGVRVVVIPDKDEAGRKHAREVAKSLQGKALDVRVMELPDRGENGEKKVKDATDWLEAGGTREELITLAMATPEWIPSADETQEDRSSESFRENLPQIDASCQDLSRVSAEAWGALRQTNLPSPRLFRRGGAVVRLERDEKDNPVMVPLSPDRVRYELARCADWYRDSKTKDEGRRPAKPPMDVVRDVLAYPDYPLPILDRIVEVPVFGPSGTVCSEPGYQEEAQVYHFPAPGLEIPEVGSEPSREDVSQARAFVLDDLLGEFPFVSEADKANAVALLLLPFVRAMVDGPTPLHLIEAPVMGSGKTLLADVLLRPALGHDTGIITEATDEDEWRKRITACLRDGRPAVVVDNVSRPLIAGALSSVLTSIYSTDRILGESATVRLPVSCAWVATGNNPTMSTEIARKTIRIRIDPKVDMPWLREGFKHPDLRAWASDRRADLVWAALTLAQSWVAAGRPSAAGRILGSYESWSRVLGGILRHAGIPGFLDNLLEFYEIADLEGAKWRSLVASWWETFKDQKVAVSELFSLVTEQGDFEVGRGDERAQKISFGKQLMRQRDRVISEKRIVEAGKVQRARVWRLLPTDAPVSVDMNTGVTGQEALGLEEEGTKEGQEVTGSGDAGGEAGNEVGGNAEPKRRDPFT